MNNKVARECLINALEKLRYNVLFAIEPTVRISPEGRVGVSVFLHDPLLQQFQLGLLFAQAVGNMGAEAHNHNVTRLLEQPYSANLTGNTVTIYWNVFETD